MRSSDPNAGHPEARGRKVISIAAAVVLDRAGRTLLVRKRGTSAFMQPGGKLAKGETSVVALEREIVEELGCGLEPSSCRTLGRFSTPAANEPGWTVEAELFAARLLGEIRLDAEIEEAIWVDPDAAPAVELAPLTRRHALPLARELKRSGVIAAEAGIPSGEMRRRSFRARAPACAGVTVAK